MGYILAGTLVTKALNQQTGKQIFRSDTLQENTLGISVTEESINGGLSNKKLGSYFHDSILNATITDALFDIEYLSANLGGTVSVGGDSFTNEQVTTTVANSITVRGTPVDFMGLGVIGRYKVQGTNVWKSLKFVAKTATATNLPVGSVVCVEYTAYNSTIREFTVSSAIVPDEVILVIEAPLFKANEKSFVQSSQVGKLVITIPRFLFTGNVDLNMTSTGASTTNLSGSALTYYSTTSCDDMGQYAKVQQIIYEQNPEDGLVNIAIEGSDIQLKTNVAETLKVMGIYENGRTGDFDNTRLTFTAKPSANVTITNDGVITASAAVSDVSLKVVVTNATDIETYGNVTATA
ncbi:MAG: hypothetical protein RSD67_02495 [Oscillospiraceae bacterium]